MSRLPLDLTELSEHELVGLNRKIVERLRFLRDVRAHHQMMELRPGDQVKFSSESGRNVVGTILRLNRKSVSLVAADGVHWRVSPALLTRAEPEDVESTVESDEAAKPNTGNEGRHESHHHQSSLPLRLVPLTTALTPNLDVPRNAPCPCGSGKKHKRCCLLKAAGR